MNQLPDVAIHHRAALRSQLAAPALPTLRSTKVLDQLRERFRLLDYSRRTEEAYGYWCRAFIRFHGIRHPLELGRAEVEAFLGWLASDRQVAASTHKQALSALRFLYSRVLDVRLPWMAEIGRPRVQRRLPVVLSRDEVRAVLCGLEGEHLLFSQLLYGTGMRLTECLQLRVKDIDFQQGVEGRGTDSVLYQHSGAVSARLCGWPGSERSACIPAVCGLHERLPTHTHPGRHTHHFPVDHRAPVPQA